MFLHSEPLDSLYRVYTAFSKAFYIMLNLPANIVRKAAGTVSSTVNSSIATVASVAKTVGISGDEHRLKDLNNELEIINDSKEKLNLHLKVSDFVNKYRLEDRLFYMVL